MSKKRKRKIVYHTAEWADFWTMSWRLLFLKLVLLKMNQENGSSQQIGKATTVSKHHKRNVTENTGTGKQVKVS